MAGAEAWRSRQRQRTSRRRRSQRPKRRRRWGIGYRGGGGRLRLASLHLGGRARCEGHIYPSCISDMSFLRFFDQSRHLDSPDPLSGSGICRHTRSAALRSLARNAGYGCFVGRAAGGSADRRCFGYRQPPAAALLPRLPATGDLRDSRCGCRGVLLCLGQSEWVIKRTPTSIMQASSRSLKGKTVPLVAETGPPYDHRVAWARNL